MSVVQMVTSVFPSSTNGVFPHGLKSCTEDADVSEQWRLLTDGYSQSKWVAEQLITRAGHRGLPVTIYRLGEFVLTIGRCRKYSRRVYRDLTDGSVRHHLPTG